jgi:hypothetical protein
MVCIRPTIKGLTAWWAERIIRVLVRSVSRFGGWDGPRLSRGEWAAIFALWNKEFPDEKA